MAVQSSARPVAPRVVRAPLPSDEGSQTRAPKAQVYLNAVWTNPQDGKPYSLPYGVGIDTMNYIDFGNSKNQEWIDDQDKRNMFLQAMKAKAEQLAPGQAENITEPVVGGIHLELRRVNEKGEASIAPNSPDREAMVSSILAAMTRKPVEVPPAE